MRTPCFSISLGLLALIGTSSSAFAGFNWGADCSSGDGTFQQYVPKGQIVTVGEVPPNKRALKISLRSETDVDVQLIDVATGTEIIAWPNGLLNGPSEACTQFKGVKYCYSGYNGDQTSGGKGNEWIKVMGDTNRKLVMRAYGYDAGSGRVDYGFAAVPTCKEKGSGSFAQWVSAESVVTVGVIPAGKVNVEIELQARDGRDVDVQLLDGDTGVVAWPNGLLNGPTSGQIEYQGMVVEYSGYNGIDGNWGHERIVIKGRLTRALTVTAFGYQSGFADVTYAWGVGAGKMCGGIAGFLCDDGLFCKGMDPNIVADAAGTCHTEMWCGGPETAVLDCANVIHIAIPGTWACEDFQCRWKTGLIQPELCTSDDPSLHYVGHSKDQCAVIKFTCKEGQSYFSDDCGCGCKDEPSCNYDDAFKIYTSTNAVACQTMLFVCVTPTKAFFDDCGCGCECPKWINCMPGPGQPGCDVQTLKKQCPNTQIAW